MKSKDEFTHHRKEIVDLYYHEKIINDYCSFCGGQHFHGLNQHHVIPKSQGGLHGCTVTLCGSGTTGCHGLVHDKRLLHFWTHEGVMYAGIGSHGYGINSLASHDDFMAWIDGKHADISWRKII